MLDSAFWLQASLAVFVLITLLFAVLWYRARAHSQLLLKTMQNSPAAQLVFDLDSGEIMFANAKLVEILQLVPLGGEYSQWRFASGSQRKSLVDLIQKNRLGDKVESVHWKLNIGSQEVILQLFAAQHRFRGKEAWFVNAYEDSQGYSYRSMVEQERTLLGDVLNSIPEFINFKDADGRLLGCNQAWSSFLGMSPSQVKGKYLNDLLTTEELQRTRSFDEQVLNGKKCQKTEWYSASDGRQILMQHNYYPLRNPRQMVTGVLNVSYDVTEWHELNRKLEQENQNRVSSERKLGRQNNLIRTVFNATPDPLGFFDENGVVIGGNEPFAKLYSLGVDEVAGKHIKELMPPEQIEQALQQNQQILDTGETLRYEELVWLETGEQIWYEVIKGPYTDDVSGERGVILITRDVTERKNTEQQLADAIMQLQELSFIDSLTQVANRRSFDEKLRNHWSTHRREKQGLSLLLLDIDCFKQYNDNYGHQKGDDALRQVAQILSSSVKRGADLVARYGGEEFAILLPNTELAGAKVIAKNILEKFEFAQIPHEHSLVKPYVTTSVGVVSLVPEQGQDYGDLVKFADLALYQAKHNGRAQLQIWDPQQELYLA